jgi:hypothetical protein
MDTLATNRITNLNIDNLLFDEKDNLFQNEHPFNEIISDVKKEYLHFHPKYKSIKYQAFIPIIILSGTVNAFSDLSYPKPNDLFLENDESFPQIQLLTQYFPSTFNPKITEDDLISIDDSVFIDNKILLAGFDFQEAKNMIKTKEPDLNIISSKFINSNKSLEDILLDNRNEIEDEDNI